MNPNEFELIGKLEKNWTDSELSQFLRFFRVPVKIIRACSDRAALIELVQQIAEDEDITASERVSASRQLKDNPSSRCPPERVTSRRYARRKEGPRAPEAADHDTAVSSQPYSFHQPHQPIEDLEDEELQFLVSHALYGSRDLRLRLDDEVYPIHRPLPNPSLEPICSFDTYRESLFDKEGCAVKSLTPLQMSWTAGLGSKCYFSEIGTEYTNHGRGPAWGGWAASGSIPITPDLNPGEDVVGVHARANSCGVDSLIVAGAFLDVGQTVADRGSASRGGWLGQLTTVQKLYLDAVRTDWNDYTAVGSIKKKKVFYDEVLRLQGYPYSRFTPAASLWTDLLAGNFHQFTFHTAVQRTCAICGAISVRGRKGGQLRLSVNVEFEVMLKNPNFTLSNYLRYYFDERVFKDKKIMQENFHHDKPASKARKVVIGGMPPRLVITPESRDQATVPLPEHTKGNISFRYEDEAGRDHSIVYRWIGGVYMHNGHYRVYWDDSESGEGRIKVYDGQHPLRDNRMALLGTIIGGIGPPSSGERVPAPWCEAPSLLFYERVDNPLDGNQINTLEGVLGKLKIATKQERSLGLLPIVKQIKRLKEDEENDNTVKIARLREKKRTASEMKRIQKQEARRRKRQAREMTLAEAQERQRFATAMAPLMELRRKTAMGKESSTTLQGLLGSPQETRGVAATIGDRNTKESIVEKAMGMLGLGSGRKRGREGNVDADGELTKPKETKGAEGDERGQASKPARWAQEGELQRSQWLSETRRAEEEEHANQLAEQEEFRPEKRRKLEEKPQPAKSGNHPLEQTSRPPRSRSLSSPSTPTAPRRFDDTCGTKTDFDIQEFT
ncbi:MAG: hypothetical protein M1840_008094 [Geoglossum simile]|nr:MAG: hypothetical protein M1840_008094 [Geoglossum simile]